MKKTKFTSVVLSFLLTAMLIAQNACSGQSDTV